MEKEQWSEDVCTCGHGVSRHTDGDGRCKGCDGYRVWDGDHSICLRFQWNSEPRKKVW